LENRGLSSTRDLLEGLVDDSVELGVDDISSVLESVLDLVLDSGLDDTTEESRDGIVEPVVLGVSNVELHSVDGDVHAAHLEGVLALRHGDDEVNLDSVSSNVKSGKAVILSSWEGLSSEPELNILKGGLDSLSRDTNEGLEVIGLEVLDIEVTLRGHADVDLVWDEVWSSEDDVIEPVVIGIVGSFDSGEWDPLHLLGDQGDEEASHLTQELSVELELTSNTLAEEVLDENLSVSSELHTERVLHDGVEDGASVVADVGQVLVVSHGLELGSEFLEGSLSTVDVALVVNESLRVLECFLEEGSHLAEETVDLGVVTKVSDETVDIGVEIVDGLLVSPSLEELLSLLGHHAVVVLGDAVVRGLVEALDELGSHVVEERADVVDRLLELWVLLESQEDVSETLSDLESLLFGERGLVSEGILESVSELLNGGLSSGHSLADGVALLSNVGLECLGEAGSSVSLFLGGAADSPEEALSHVDEVDEELSELSRGDELSDESSGGVEDVLGLTRDFASPFSSLRNHFSGSSSRDGLGGSLSVHEGLLDSFIGVLLLDEFFGVFQNGLDVSNSLGSSWWESRLLLLQELAGGVDDSFDLSVGWWKTLLNRRGCETTQRSEVFPTGVT